MKAGFLGGLVGLGGGVVLTPVWLETGIHPPRAAASATFTVMFTSFTSVFIIALSGGYHLSQFLILAVIYFKSLIRVYLDVEVIWLQES